MCAIYSLHIILLVNNIRVRNFHRFGWNENFENFANYGTYGGEEAMSGDFFIEFQRSVVRGYHI